MERELLPGGEDFCTVAQRWEVSPDVMRRVMVAADLFLMQTRSPVWIISGGRTASQQRALGRLGRPTAPDELSTHRSCPATGVDISLGTLPSRGKKLLWGALVQLNGLRWGGGSDVDEHGIPGDWQHVDLGPRNSG